MDSVNQTFGWTYEKLNDGVVTKTEAEFNEEYGTIIKGGHADAVKMTRVMTPVDIDGPDIEVTIINPETLGVEIFVDGEISYSSFGRGERNKAGYMIIDEKILQNFPLVKGEEKLCVFLCLMTM